MLRFISFFLVSPPSSPPSPLAVLSSLIRSSFCLLTLSFLHPVIRPSFHPPVLPPCHDATPSLHRSILPSLLLCVLTCSIFWFLASLLLCCISLSSGLLFLPYLLLDCFLFHTLTCFFQTLQYFSFLFFSRFVYVFLVCLLSFFVIGFPFFLFMFMFPLFSFCLEKGGSPCFYFFLEGVVKCFSFSFSVQCTRSGAQHSATQPPRYTTTRVCTTDVRCARHSSTCNTHSWKKVNVVVDTTSTPNVLSRAECCGAHKQTWTHPT